MERKTECECPFHHKRWRARTQCLLNALRGSVLESRHVRQFPAVVCTCKDRGHAPSLALLDTLPSLTTWVAKEGQDYARSDATRKAFPLLQYYIKAAGASDLSEETRAGLIGVAAVIKDTFQGDFHRLEPSSCDKQESGDSQSLKESTVLSLPCTYLGVYMGKSGKHIKALSKKHDMSVHFSSSSSYEPPVRRGMTSWLSGSSVKATIHYSRVDRSKLEQFKLDLETRATVVIQHRKQHSDNCAAFYSRRALGRASRGYTTPGVYGTPKEAAIGQFEKKQQNSAKHKPGNGGKPSFAALSDGHCLHCLAPYSPGQLKDGECTYHEGFLAPVKPGKSNRGYSWTCCGKRTDQSHATQELHTRTGCAKGRHVWRAGKSGKGKAGKEAGGSEDFSV